MVEHADAMLEAGTENAETKRANWHRSLQHSKLIKKTLSSVICAMTRLLG
jgi:hypothetical protein